MGNKLTTMAKELLMIEEDIPFRLDYSKEKPSVNDFEVHVFEQTWADTSLGFGGIGGQTITAATTYVLVPIHCEQKCLVYFAGRFAYGVEYSDVFMEDVMNRQMEPVYKKDKYSK